MVVASCAGSGCGKENGSTLRKLVQMPELYLERARECKDRQLRGDKECKISLEEIQEKREAEARRGR